MEIRLFIRPWLVLGLAVFSALGASAWGESLPVIVVTMSSIDTLLERVDHVAKVTGFSDSPQINAVRGGIEGFAQGLDRQRPLALLLQADESSYQVFAMLPVVDLSKWVRALPALGGSATETENGVYQVQLGTQAAFLSADGDWAYLSQTAESLERHPEEPLEVLQGLETQYDLAVRFIVQNIPEAARDFGLNQYRNMMQMALSRAAEEDSPQAQFQRANLERQLAEVQRFAEEADLITIGLRMNPAKQVTVGEFGMTAVSGSRLDRRMAVTEKAETRFGGFFFPKGTATASMCYPVLPEDAQDQAEQWGAVLAMLKGVVAGEDFAANETAREELQGLLDDLDPIMRESLARGAVDSAMTLVTGAEQLNLIAASQMAGGDRWEGILQRLQKIADAMEIPADFRLKFSQQDDVVFHAAQFALPESQELSRAFGDKLTAYMGVSSDTIYLGIGEKSLGGLRKAIAASGGSPQPVPSLRALLSVGGLVGYAAQIMEREEAQAAADAFRKEDGQDHIRVSQQMDRGGGLVTRLEIQDGVLAALGQIARDRMESP